MKSRMKSMFCWHTCGTIYKLAKDFGEAAKCFQNALRMEPDNIQLMRETACLHIQVRDHANHVAARLAVLKSKPGLIQNWVAFTIAHHLVLLFSHSVATTQLSSRRSLPSTTSSKLPISNRQRRPTTTCTAWWRSETLKNGRTCTKSSTPTRSKSRMR